MAALTKASKIVLDFARCHGKDSTDHMPSCCYSNLKSSIEHLKLYNDEIRDVELRSSLEYLQLSEQCYLNSWQY